MGNVWLWHRGDLESELRGKAEIFIPILLIVDWVTFSKRFRPLTHSLEALTDL